MKAMKAMNKAYTVSVVPYNNTKNDTKNDTITVTITKQA